MPHEPFLSHVDGQHKSQNCEAQENLVPTATTRTNEAIAIFPLPVVFQVDVCLFDKTGTITSDKLRAENLVVPHSIDPDSPPATIGLGRSSARSGTNAGSASPGLAAEVGRNKPVVFVSRFNAVVAVTFVGEASSCGHVASRKPLYYGGESSPARDKTARVPGSRR